MQLRDYRLVHIVGMLAFDVTRHAELFEFYSNVRFSATFVEKLFE
jgi:hypothetical protein